MASILIVDDDPDMRLLTRRLVGMVGCEGSEAKNGLEAETRALEMQPDIVLLDIMMPGQDGYETCANLRERGYSGVIILVSALQQASIKDKITACGASAYIQKPITKTLLKSYVEQVRSEPA
jgi:CheY-like chemotaxis protein